MELVWRGGGRVWGPPMSLRHANDRRAILSKAAFQVRGLFREGLWGGRGCPKGGRTPIPPPLARTPLGLREG